MVDTQVLSQWFSFEQQGTSLTGVAGIWESSDDERVYVLYHISSPDAYPLEWIEEEFQRYLDSFKVAERDKTLGYQGPYYPTEGWRYAEPETMDMDSEKLLEMVQAVNEQGIGADSLLVARDGYVVLDAYFSPFDERETHITYSCTKSVVSTLIGIAVKDGYLDSLDVKLLEIFDNRNVENPSGWKSEITLENLLTMTAGIDGRDSYLYDWEGLERMHSTNDWVTYILGLPMASEPGTRFEYTNGVSHILSAIISETTGMHAAEYAEENLFNALGISDYSWNTDPTGVNWGYSGLYLTPQDMAKIGYLFLNHGVWEGEELLSEEWVKQATMKHVDANTLFPGYGYQWWVSPNGYYTALGYKGQFIHVVPEHDLVMVTTSSSEEDFGNIQQLLEAYVIPAVID
jgi:CubicO group peptidase (beta-lactamase class C family)